MLVLIFLFLSFFQVGLLGIGGSAGAQALLEHEVLTLHQWLTPAQMADLMAFCRLLPGGTGVNTATLTGYVAVASRFGFMGCIAASLVSVAGLAVPSALWSALMAKLHESRTFSSWLDCVEVVLRPLVPGLVAAAAILLMRQDIFSSFQQSPWNFCVSVFLFFATLVGVGLYRFNAAFMIILCGIAGCILL